MGLVTGVGIDDGFSKGSVWKDGKSFSLVWKDGFTFTVVGTYISF